MSLKCIWIAIAVGSVTAAAAAPTSRPERSKRIVTAGAPIDVYASKSKIDYRNQHAELENPTITQADIRVTADHAVGNGTAFDFSNNRWVFTGNVHIHSEQHGELTSESATVEFRDGQMQSALVVGHPAEFEQTESTSGVLARGHADSIEYDVAASTVRLTDDAWLKYGDSIESAPVLVYDINAQRLLGAGVAKSGGRVHITMLPNKSLKNGAAPAPKRASETPGKLTNKPAVSPRGGSGIDP